MVCLLEKSSCAKSETEKDSTPLSLLVSQAALIKRLSFLSEKITPDKEVDTSIHLHLRMILLFLSQYKVSCTVFKILGQSKICTENSQHMVEHLT